MTFLSTQYLISRPGYYGLHVWLQRVPKIEIHTHLEGSLFPGLLLRLAQRHGCQDSVPDLHAAEELYRFEKPLDFFRGFLRVSEFARIEDDLADLVEDAGRRLIEQGCLYVEWTFAPQKYVRCGIPYPAILSALQAGLDRLEGRLEVGFIIDLVRNLGKHEAARTMGLLRAHPHPLVTGIGLGGTEDFGPEPFAESFQIARDMGLGVTAHAGELEGPGSIRATLESLGVKRIDHGVRAIEEADLVKELAHEGIVLNLCPTSNFRLGVAQDLSDYPLRAFLNAGILVTIGSDDPAFFETTLTGELELAVLCLGMSPLEIIDAQRQAIKTSFLTDERRERLLARFEVRCEEAGAPPCVGLPD